MLHLGILCVPFSLALEQAGVPGGDFGAVVLQLPGLARAPPPPPCKGIFGCCISTQESPCSAGVELWRPEDEKKPKE